MEQKENGPSCPESAFGSRRLKVQNGPVLSIEPWAAGLDSLPPMGSAGAVESAHQVLERNDLLDEYP